MARQPGLHHELVLIDQSQPRQRQRKLHASHEYPFAVGAAQALPTSEILIHRIEITLL
jgi:hypothetical protein